MKSLFRKIRDLGGRVLGATGAGPRFGGDLAALLPAWSELIAREPKYWRDCLRRAEDGPKVLIANNVAGFYPSTIFESLLAAALTVRGVQVHVVQCDRVLPACLKTKFSNSPPDAVIDGSFRNRICDRCVEMGQAFTQLGVEVHLFSEQLTLTDREEIAAIVAETPVDEIPAFQLDGQAIGEHALAGCLRYFSTGNLDEQPHSDGVLRKYFQASLVSARVMEKILGVHNFTAACFHHGIYVPQGIVSEVCRSRDVRVVTWNVAYRKRCFIFSHGDTYHHTMLDEPVSTWRDMEFTDTHDEVIRKYLASRWHGSQDWIYFHDTPDDDVATLVEETGIDLSKPIIGMLTNVMWDAQLHYRANAFPNMLDWILKTVEYFATRPDLQLLIRVHPAELRGLQPSRQFVVDEIAKVFPTLPPNVFVIPPESNVNTYAAMSRCNTTIIYGTKTGVELTSMGIPVIVAGEAWIRGKGLTTDVSSEEEYFSILAGLPLADGRLDAEIAREARKYAFHFFLRRMIPVSSIEPREGAAPFGVSISSLKDLEPGRDDGLDLICDGILRGREFVYPAETRMAAVLEE